MATPRVLIVEDDPTILNLLEAMVTDKLRLRCAVASNGQEALNIIESTPLDIVVTDLKMPVMDGVALLRFVRASYPEIDVIVAGTQKALQCGRCAAWLSGDFARAACSAKPSELPALERLRRCNALTSLLGRGIGPRREHKRDSRQRTLRNNRTVPSCPRDEQQ